MGRGVSSVVAVALSALALAGCAGGSGSTAATSAASMGITTRGIGTVTTTPDTVTVVVGVQTRGPSAKAALDENTSKATALINMFKSRGVAAADLQTSQLSVSPTYDPATGRIISYEVTDQVTATLHDVHAAGGLIDAAGEAAGDAVRIQQLSFSISDDSALRAQARADAVRQAQAHARQLADAAGVRLGRMYLLTEVPATPPGPLGREAAPAPAAPVPIEPGSQKLTVMVELAYAIDE
ncbi:MAG TPA: SIMPL domain-containing protein [Pseudonocardiaceae bacterium]|jgi:uncharacterized protein YggE|nr:SIMPL domain-containing protein [Pseudonocardiaceae bacterium]